MARGLTVSVVIAIALHGSTSAAGVADPDTADAKNVVAVDGAAELGILSTNHATVTGSYARTLWDDRLYVELRLGTGTTGTLVIIEERLGAGVRFAPSRRTELRVGWRIGHSHFGGTLGNAAFATDVLAIELAVMFGLHVGDHWRLRVVPLAPTVFWNRTYGGSAGLEVGVGYAF